MSRVDAATYTHRLQYTNTDNAGTADLYADVVFDDGTGAAQSNTSGSPSIVSGFTPSITYYFTPVPGGTTYTLVNSDFTQYRITHKSEGSTDYDGDPTLISQLNNLQFGNFEGSGSFSLSMSNTLFSLDARLPGAGQTEYDFLLSSTAEFPAPIPLLGILPAFSSIRRLKKRFNSKLNS